MAEGQSATGAVSAVVLAAGKSTRMRSKTPKTLHTVCGKPLLAHILDALSSAGVTRRVVVVGHQADTVCETLDKRYGTGSIEYAIQAEQKGTGHAALMAELVLANAGGIILILPGDAPLLSAGVLRQLIAHHLETGAVATLLTALLDQDAGAYGRVVRDEADNVLGVVEARDASPAQLAIREINTSVYAFSGAELFHALHNLQPNNAQGELYLTDVIGLLRQAGKRVAAFVSPDADVVLGVNTRVELAEIGAKMRAGLLRELMLSGVTIVDPVSTYVEADVTVGQDTIIGPNTHLLAGTLIGEDCEIGPNVYLTRSRLGNRVRARFALIDQATIDDDVKIGPFAHIRPGTHLMRGVRIGNFVETKSAILHEKVAAGHLSYLGDTEIGAGTNIGAGTITANYDGQDKHRTVIGKKAFIGTHSTLIAPVTIGDGAQTAAGSTITHDVPADSLAIARERQVVKEGWAAARRSRREKDVNHG